MNEITKIQDKGSRTETNEMQSISEKLPFNIQTKMDNSLKITDHHVLKLLNHTYVIHGFIWRCFESLLFEIEIEKPCIVIMCLGQKFEL